MADVKNHHKRGTKFTDTEREQVKAIVAGMDARGYSQRTIVAKLRDQGIVLTQPMICNYLRDIREEWTRVQVAKRSEAVARKIAQYERVREEAWAAYDRSKEDAETVKEEFIPPPPDGSPAPKAKIGSREQSLLRIGLIKTTEGRLPANEYLSTIMKTLEAERQLLGLDEQPPGGAGDTNVNVGVAVQVTLKGLLDAARDQMNVGRVPEIANGEVDDDSAQ